MEKKKLIKPESPAGFLDFLTPDFLARESVLKVINQVFRSYGYDQIEGPVAEFLDVLTGEDETSKNIFLLRDNGRTSTEQPMALRFDHTVQTARILAANPYNPKTKTGIKLPWRRMVVGPSFRTDTPQNGRYRQFYQFDIDILGTSSMLADAEVVSIINETFRALGITNFLIKINNRKILNGLGELIGLKSRPKVDLENILRAIFRILDKLDKIGLDGVERELLEAPENEYDPRPNLSPLAVEKIKELISISGGNSERLAAAKQIFKGIKTAEEGLLELEDIIWLCSDISEVIKVDFTVVRGLDYYTGPVMETSLLDAPDFGSVFSGGRYDNLMERFTGQALPAVGASIGVDRLFAALKHLGIIKTDRQSATEVVILNIDESLTPLYLQVAKEIREWGFNVEICLLEDKTFKSQFNFALSRGADFLIILGADEAARGVVKLKNLSSREQLELSPVGLYHYFQKLVVTELAKKLTEGVKHEN